jgi:transcriptional regulator with XRE-family HTH domain
MKADILEMALRPGLRQQRTRGIDRHIGARLRQQRVMNGLTQQALADRIGVSCQQAHQYEKGASRIAASRLYIIAQVLGVHVGYFFEGLQSPPQREPTPQHGVFLDLARNFRSIRPRKHQEVICLLTRILADLDKPSDTDAWDVLPELAGSA